MGEETKEKPIRLLWGSDEDIPILYANQMLVSHSGGTEFHIVFGHVSPPITVGLEEEELPDSVTIKPITKLVMSPDVMRSFAKAINTNLELYEKTISEGTHD